VTSAAPGTLIVTGGVGADAYRLGEFSQGLTVNDFSLAKGDTLTVDNYFKGHGIKSITDGAGGTFLDLADGPHHYVQVDLKGVIVGTNIVHFAAVGVASAPRRTYDSIVAGDAHIRLGDTPGRALGHYVMKNDQPITP
jgi:hypothetical protein